MLEHQADGLGGWVYVWLGLCAAAGTGSATTPSSSGPIVSDAALASAALVSAAALATAVWYSEGAIAKDEGN